MNLRGGGPGPTSLRNAASHGSCQQSVRRTLQGFHGRLILRIHSSQAQDILVRWIRSQTQADGIQLVRMVGEDYTQGMSTAMLALSRLARELNVAVLILASASAPAEAEDGRHQASVISPRH